MKRLDGVHMRDSLMDDGKSYGGQRAVQSFFPARYEARGVRASLSAKLFVGLGSSRCTLGQTN